MTGWKIQKMNESMCFSLLKIRHFPASHVSFQWLEPENHRFEQENHLRQTFTAVSMYPCWCLSAMMFWGVISCKPLRRSPQFPCWATCSFPASCAWWAPWVGAPQGGSEVGSYSSFVRCLWIVPWYSSPSNHHLGGYLFKELFPFASFRVANPTTVYLVVPIS